MLLLPEGFNRVHPALQQASGATDCSPVARGIYYCWGCRGLAYTAGHVQYTDYSYKQV